MAGTRPQRRPAKAGKLFEPASRFDTRVTLFVSGAIAIVDRIDLSAFVLCYITALDDPVAAKGCESVTDIAFDLRIAPGSAGIVESDRFACLNLSQRHTKVSAGSLLVNAV
jgi:hypothetical protein